MHSMLQLKILIVDDDEHLSYLLKYYLCDQGFGVDIAGDGQQMFKKMDRNPFDLIILDWMLPGEDGLSICRRLSQDENSPPVIMVTGSGGEADRILGLDCGADDYLSKPFNPRELLARIHAVLRRNPRLVAAIPEANHAPFYFGPYLLDFSQRCLFRDDFKIDLTNSEFGLLKVLAQQGGVPLTRERLGHLVDGRNHKPSSRSIDIQISRLRRLLEDDPTHPSYLQTVRGLGYVLVKKSADE
ncbi:response regulator [Methylobacter sp. S3L5C]|nr:response regulator [Methylobacter sp. S3L5C]